MTESNFQQIKNILKGIEDAIFHRMFIGDVICIPAKSLPVHGFEDNNDTIDSICARTLRKADAQ